MKKYRLEMSLLPVAVCLLPLIWSCGKSSELPEAPKEAQSEGAGGAPSGLVVTDVRKEKDGTYSATLNSALVFKGLEIKPVDDGKEKLFFPKTAGKGDRTFPMVYLDDRSIAEQIKKAAKDEQAVGKGDPSALKVSEVKWRSFDSPGKLKGFADVTFNNAVTVKGCKLIEGGKTGWFIGWPSVKTGEDKYDDMVFALDEEVREMVEKAVKKESGL